MSTITDNLDKIRGWRPITGNPYIDRHYDIQYYPYAVVRDAIVDCLSELASRYEVLLGDEINTIETAKWMPSVKQAIYDACVKIATKLAINPFVELSKIKAAHFGSELREPIYDIFIKFGILEEHYDPTDENDYVYIDDTIIYYVGDKTRVSVPTTLNGVPVTTLSSVSFNNNSDLVGVSIPEGVTSIE